MKTILPMLKKNCIIPLLLLLPYCGFTQTMADSAFINPSAFNDSALVVNKAMLFYDSNDVATMANLLSQNFVPFSRFDYQHHISAKLVPKTAYLQIGVINSKAIPDTIYLFPGVIYDEVVLYRQTGANTLSFVADESKSGFAQLALQKGERAVFFIKLKFCRQTTNYLMPVVISAAYLPSFKNLYRTRTENTRFVGYLTSGMLFLILLLIGVNYFLSGKKEFLYYFGYAFATFLLMLLSSYLYSGTGSFNSFFFGYFDLALLTTGNVLYLAFIRHFIETKTTYHILDRVFKSVEFFLLLLLAVFTILHYFTEMFWLENALENLMKVIMLGIGIFFIIIALKQKKRLTTYLAIGSALNILFSFVSLLLIWLIKKQTTIFHTPFFYYNVGSVFSIAFFLLGLTYKNRRELIENIENQAALKLDIERKALENQIAIIKAQQEERNRISADMHDDLGAGMTTIRLYSELAKGKLGDTTIPEIEKISASANELLTKMNAIIWSMSSSNDSLGNMIAYIRSYSLEYFEDTGVNCRISIPEDLPNIVVSGAMRRNIFLVVKEALNNVLKHAQATEVNIVLERVADGLKLSIHDNGRGIDFEKLRQFGNGLKNMKKRMNDLGISFTIENKNGTLITLYRAVAGLTLS